MNEEICITNNGKMAKYEWDNLNSDFLQALHSIYKKLGQFVFQTLLNRDASSCYKLQIF